MISMPRNAMLVLCLFASWFCRAGQAPDTVIKTGYESCAAQFFCPDLDGDLWGDEEFCIDACERPYDFTLGSGGDCDNTNPAVNPAATEQCDGIDNNCADGVDEGNPGGGDSCKTGQAGICAAGTTQCSAGAIACFANQSPQMESCDGVDNDCDGAIDDGNPGGGGFCVVPGMLGVCQFGEQTCQGGALSCLGPAPGTIEEVCDNQDNNCDGAIDNLPPVGPRPCTTAEPGRCAAGHLVCAGGMDICVRDNDPIEEFCDGQDNDCDGATDEGNPGGGMSCMTGLAGICAAGTSTCNAGSIQCLANQNATTEVCDGQDNDCDGATDEGNPGGGMSCMTGQPGICAAGTSTCNAGSIQCLANQNATTEVCDGQDNDCDGATDEGNPGGGMSCMTGQPGICAAGTTTCNTGSIQCLANQNATTEVCDGQDNDCDGATDEGNAGGGGACMVGACPGTLFCSTGALQCVKNVPSCM